MHSLSSLIVIATSFVSLAVAGPFNPTTPSSRFAKGPLSSRQFQYPRALFDVCSDIDLGSALESVIGVNLGNLGDICLCLSGFPLDLDLYTNLQVPASLLGGTTLNSLLQSLVKGDGAKCTYPDHASPACASGNPCGFTCTDGFVQVGAACVCTPPNIVCNGKCGSYQNGCSSALPKASKMVRRRIASGLKSSDSSPKSNGVRQSTDPTAAVSVTLGGALGNIGGLVESIVQLVNGILQSLLGPGVTTQLVQKPTSSSTSTPGQADVIISIDLSGLIGPTLSSQVDQILSMVSQGLTGLLRSLGLDLDLSVVVNISGAPGSGLNRTSRVNVEA